MKRILEKSAIEPSFRSYSVRGMRNWNQLTLVVSPFLSFTPLVRMSVINEPSTGEPFL